VLDVALLGTGGYSLVDRPPINLLSTGRMDIEDSARRGCRLDEADGSVEDCRC
jgi:hypothetical protein